MGPKTEAWRTVLCWGAVITFLALPPVFLITYAIAIETPGFHFEDYARDLKFIRDFYLSITGMAFGLSGLNSLDRFIEIKNGNKKDGKTGS